MRCPSCNKFASQSIDSNEPEMDIDIDDTTGQITGTVRIVVTAECCGDELKEATLDVDIDFPDADVLKKHQGKKHSLSIDQLSVEAVDEYQTTDRRGKPIRNPRYQTHRSSKGTECLESKPPNAR